MPQGGQMVGVVNAGNGPYVVVNANDGNDLLSKVATFGGVQPIFIPSGTYALSATLTIPTGALIQGSGLTTILYANPGVTPVVKFSDGDTHAVLRDVYVRGRSEANQIGVWMGERQGNYNIIENVQVAFTEIGLYFELDQGNTCTVRNVTTLSIVTYAVQINGANQLYFYDLHLACLAADGHYGIGFGPYMARTAYQTQNVKFFGGWIWEAQFPLRFINATATGLRISFYGMGFEAWESLIDLEADQNGNLYMDFFGCISFTTSRAMHVVHGSGLTQLAGWFNFNECSWIGAVNGSFTFTDQATSKARIKLNGHHKFSTFPTTLTDNYGTSSGTGAQQTIPHGLVLGPTRVILTESTTGGALPYLSAAPDGTNLYITAVNAKTYGWYAEYT